MVIMCQMCSRFMVQSDRTSITPCGHLFHADCLVQPPSSTSSSSSDSLRVAECPVCPRRFDAATEFRRIYLPYESDGTTESLGALHNALADEMRLLRARYIDRSVKAASVAHETNVFEDKCALIQAELSRTSAGADARLDELKLENGTLLTDALVHETEEQLCEQLRDAQQRQNRFAAVKQLHDADTAVESLVRQECDCETCQHLDRAVLQMKQRLMVVLQKRDACERAKEAAEARRASTEYEIQMLMRQQAEFRARLKNTLQLMEALEREDDDEEEAGMHEATAQMQNVVLHDGRNGEQKQRA